MGNSPTPPGLIERIMQMVDERFAAFARSGFLRNATISAGGLTIKGGFLRMLSAITGGVTTFYVGPTSPALPDGSYQPTVIIRRNDGTVALLLWDPRPDLDGYNQFLGWYDRSGNAVMTDDTVSGQGLGRPYLPGVAYPSQARHWPSGGTTGWEPLYRVMHNKQQPRLFARAWGSCDTAGTTGQMRLMVDGNQLGATQNVNAAAVTEFAFGPAPVAGTFGQYLSVELQVQRTAGTGAVQACFGLVEGRQS